MFFKLLFYDYLQKKKNGKDWGTGTGVFNLVNFIKIYKQIYSNIFSHFLKLFITLKKARMLR